MRDRTTSESAQATELEERYGIRTVAESPSWSMLVARLPLAIWHHPLRSISVFLLACPIWVVLSYGVYVLAGYLFGYAGHPGIPDMPKALYFVLFVILLPAASLWSAWVATRPVSSWLVASPARQRWAELAGLTVVLWLFLLAGNLWLLAAFDSNPYRLGWGIDPRDILPAVVLSAVFAAVISWFLINRRWSGRGGA